MLIQLQPVQISLLWNEIKDSLVRANQVPAEKQERYTYKALKHLLSGTHQCWVVFSEDDARQRRINAIGITAIVEDGLFNARHLKILSLYGYRFLTDELTSESFGKLKEYAVSNKCEEIRMETRLARIKHLATLVGFTELSSNYSLHI